MSQKSLFNWVDSDSEPLEKRVENAESAQSINVHTGDVGIRVHLQVWQDDQAIEVDTVQYTVPVEDAQSEEGKWLPDASGKSDHLKYHKDAPNRVTEWDGPFYIKILHWTAAGTTTVHP